MDEGKSKKQGKWSWLPAAMPGVAKLMVDWRKRLGDAHVNDCWERGMAGEPGWFFAREGAIAIGTPFPVPAGAGPEWDWAEKVIKTGQAVVYLREPAEGNRGTH